MSRGSSGCCAARRPAAATSSASTQLAGSSSPSALRHQRRGDAVRRGLPREREAVLVGDPLLVDHRVLARQPAQHDAAAVVDADGRPLRVVLARRRASRPGRTAATGTGTPRWSGRRPGRSAPCCRRSTTRTADRRCPRAAAPSGRLARRSRAPSVSNVPICWFAPRFCRSMKTSPAISSENRVQRWHRTQRSRSSRICVEIAIGLGNVRLTSTNRVLARPLLIAWFCRGHSPPLSHTGQSSGWLMSSSSMTPCWALSASGDVCCVLTCMPGVASSVQLACGFGILASLPSRPGRPDLDQALAARAGRGEQRVVAEPRDLDAQLLGGADDERALGHGRLDAVDGERDRRRRARPRAAPGRPGPADVVGPEDRIVMRAPLRAACFGRVGEQRSCAPAGTARPRACASPPRTRRGSTARPT